MISAQGLTKYYGDKAAISDLSFEIDEGEIVGILGLNGAGKTTALRVLACLLLPSSGTIRVKNLDVVENPHEIRKLVGFLPETPPLYGEMTVEAYLLFAAKLRGLSNDRARERLEETLQATNIADVRRQIIDSLSHGYRQRVGIAQAVIHDPAVLILDEPIQGLDPVQIVEMRELVRRLKGRHTILISSHILTEIHQTCDKILMLQQGRIVASGTEEEVTRSLSGAHRLHLTVRGEREKVLGAVRGLPSVDSCDPSRPRNRLGVADEDIVYLEVSTQDDVREAISRQLVEQGFGLLELSSATAELESVFVQLSRQSADTGASPAVADASPAKEGA